MFSKALIIAWIVTISVYLVISYVNYLRDTRQQKEEAFTELLGALYLWLKKEGGRIELPIDLDLKVMEFLRDGGAVVKIYKEDTIVFELDYDFINKQVLSGGR